MADFNTRIIEEFRENAGIVGAPFAGTPLLLLGTIGARSGSERTNPLAYLEDGDRLIVIASWAGASMNPPWYYNLLENPEVTIELGTAKFRATATVLAEPERTTLYAKMAEAMSVFNDYAAKTTRVIPVITLTKT